MLITCNSKGMSTSVGCPISVLQMEDFLHTKVENTKLSPWYFAVHWSSIHLQEKIVESERLGVDPTYDMLQLKQLQDLEQFLKMSWDAWLDGIEARQTAQEAK